MRRRAITILEILVVVAILAVLATFAAKAAMGAKRAAKGTVDISNMRQLYLGVQLYLGDYNDWAPKLLTEARSYVGSDTPYSSPLDPRPQDTALPGWTPAPCGPPGATPRVTYRVSYPYLRSVMPFDTYSNDRWDFDFQRRRPWVGVIASPWVGEILEWPSGKNPQGEQDASSFGPRMRGPILRICMDGSLYRIHKRSDEGYLGAGSYDMFWYRNGQAIPADD